MIHELESALERLFSISYMLFSYIHFRCKLQSFTHVPKSFYEERAFSSTIPEDEIMEEESLEAKLKKSVSLQKTITPPVRVWKRTFSDDVNHFYRTGVSFLLYSN